MNAMGGGQPLTSRVHVLQVEHDGGIPLSLARLTHVLHQRLKCILPMKVFTTIQPQQDLGSVFTGHAHRELLLDSSNL